MAEQGKTVTNRGFTKLDLLK